jgi:hypothetical protein
VSAEHGQVGLFTRAEVDELPIQAGYRRSIAACGAPPRHHHVDHKPAPLADPDAPTIEGP